MQKKPQSKSKNSRIMSIWYRVESEKLFLQHNAHTYAF